MSQQTSKLVPWVLGVCAVTGIVWWFVADYQHSWKHPEPKRDSLTITTKTTTWRDPDGKVYDAPGAIEVWRDGELEHFDERVVVIFVDKDGRLRIRER